MQQLTHLITQYGYLAVFVLMLAESACIPVPSEVIMMFGGAMAAGAFGGAQPLLIGVVVAGVLGNLAGSYLAWAAGKYAGQAAIGRWGRRIGIREHELGRATSWFERYGPVAVLIGRVIPVIRTFISLPAGLADMPASQFGLYTAVGCIPWTAALGIAGYALGANWETVANDFHGPTYAIAGVLAVAVVVLLVRRRRTRNAQQAGSAINPGTAGPNGRAVPAGMAAPGGHDGAALAAPAWAAGRPPASADWSAPATNWSAPAADRPAQSADRPARAGDRPGQYGERPAGKGGAFPGQQPPSPYARGPQDAHRPTLSGPRDEWSDGPQDPWAQPSGRPNR